MILGRQVSKFHYVVHINSLTINTLFQPSYVFLKFTPANTNAGLTDNPLYNERELLCRTADGDEAAFTLLLRQFRNKVYTQTLVYLKSAVTAQEITQDIFLKIWANRSGLPQVENFSGYLFIITRNEIVSALRKKGREQTTPSETLEENGWIPDQQLLYKESYKLLLEGIEALPPARKNVFKMSRLEGLSYEEIAVRLGISRNGVKDHIVKSLVFLRNFLHAHTGDTFILFWVLGELAIS
jgi:RNA polymerase sigma-70 factor (ECF subfamily)